MQLDLTALAAGLRLVEAPGLGALFGHLCDRLDRDPLPPFERELIVVADNRGLALWLELRLADRLRSAAGIDVLPLQGLADMLVRRAAVKRERPPLAPHLPSTAIPTTSPTCKNTSFTFTASGGRRYSACTARQ